MTEVERGASQQTVCPPCEEPEGHQYDDDRTNLLYGWPGPWARLGDPCMWCDHEKCAACPPPRGGTFHEEHDAGRENCWNEGCARCGERARAENERVTKAFAALQETP